MSTVVELPLVVDVRIVGDAHPDRDRCRRSGSDACSITGAGAEGHGRTVTTSGAHRDAPSVTPDGTAAPERVVDFRPRTIFRVLLIVAGRRGHARGGLDRAARARVGRDRALPRARPRSARRLRSSGEHELGRGAAIGVAYLICCDRDRRGRRDVPAEADRRGERVRAGDARTTSTTSRTAAGGSASSRRSTTSSRRCASRSKNGGASKVLGLSGAALSVTKSVITIVARDGHDHLPDVLHAARGPRLGRARLLAVPRAVAGALAQRRRRHLQDGRRLRDRQHPDQRDRRRVRDDRAADHGRAVRGRARAARRAARPDPARRRDGRRDHRRRRRLPAHASRPGSCS